ncbi:InlB B-repeat-containing protein [Actinocrispum wychmicini]|uniref:PKD domain-containing protein n=1 Tax=Actinocrispum wychmicini TaxID=1213861 RepID=A0A4R2JSN9_9PSEU|nr:hypothetical protein [Actinocrispum wychmicini]TCO59899.1 hypothetical protein EV192_104742 [Actinocrispum wychmicini]
MRFSRLARRPAVVMTAVAGVAVAGVVVVGVGQGNPTQGVRLLSGQAWFASGKVGQVTLLDGASAEVAAQVKVAAPGDMLDVVQQGNTAYTVDQSAGMVRRVDGATFAPTPPATPIADARGSGLTVIAGPNSLYTLDNTRGILVSTDPKTLDRRGEMVSVAGRLAAGTVTVDDAGTLWAVDTATGDLNRVAGQDKIIRSGVVKPGVSTITIANGRPVIVDLADRTATSVDRDTGRTVGSFGLDLRTDDKVQVSGSPNADRIYVVATRGVLDVCDVAAQRCASAIPLTAGSDFGPAVEAGDRVFVPDYTTGQVLVVSLRESRVIARPNVLRPNVRFQLLTRDGVVFYNDAGSEEAGVIKLDGSLTTIRKYDPANPEQGVARPDTGGQQPTQGAGRTSDQRPADSSPRTDPSHPNDPQTPQVVVSNATPVVDEPIDLKVVDASGTPAHSAHWTYGDGTEGDGPATTHKWATARQAPYIVTVEATMSNGQKGSKTVNITVGDKHRFHLQVNVSDGGTVTSEDHKIVCPGTCSAELDPRVQITLTAKENNGHLLGSWSGACSGTDAKCDVLMDGPKTVTYQFGTVQPIHYTMTQPTGGTISVDGTVCPPKCTYQKPPGQPVTLKAAVANADYDFQGWAVGCPVKTQTDCTASFDHDVTLSANFASNKWTLTVHVTGSDPMYDPNVTGPHGLNCRFGSSGTCVVKIPKTEGTVTLKGASNSGDTSISSWDGPCQGHYSGWPATCQFQMDGDKTTTAKFTDY